MVETEIEAAAGYVKPDESWLKKQDFPALRDTDISQAVKFLLITDYSVNITELMIKPTGELF